MRAIYLRYFPLIDKKTPMVIFIAVFLIATSLLAMNESNRYTISVGEHELLKVTLSLMVELGGSDAWELILDEDSFVTESGYHHKFITFSIKTPDKYVYSSVDPTIAKKELIYHQAGLHEFLVPKELKYSYELIRK